MPGPVASRNTKSARASRDSAPPAKKAKLAQSTAASRQNGLRSLINGTTSQLPTAKINGAKNVRKDRVNESTLVADSGHATHGDVAMEDAGNEVIEIGSSEEDEEEDSEAESDDDAAPAVNGTSEQQDGIAEDEVAEEELSFGDRLRAQEPEAPHESRIIDVDNAFFASNPDLRALSKTNRNGQLSAPASHSLGELLTQALRTNDKDQLDLCLRTTEYEVIRATIERLPSPLVGTLLQKVAEILHKKPGRAGVFMVWVQWSLAAHGGYLASQPQLVKQLSTLSRVLKERANSIQPLLQLKGRLDMLDAQLSLRKRNQQRAVNDDEDEAVIYVEGEDDYVSEDESEDGGESKTLQKRLTMGSDVEVESSADEMPTTMEVDEDSEEGSDDSDDLLDDEAEETDADSGDDMSEPVSDDLDDGEEISESEEEAKPARRSTAARAGIKSKR